VKRLFSSPESSELGLLKARLENAGIRCAIRNEFLSQAIPGVAFEAELWVLDDEDYGEACELLAAWQHPPAR
jgi:hypothetical protein